MRLVPLIFLLLCAFTLQARTTVTLPDPRDQSEDSCGRNKSCKRCHHQCKAACPCSCNPYKCSEVDNVYDEVEPSWPSRMDAPFQDEMSR